jgi:DNA invertase Pin-like site-specific DNA recombinase
MRCRRAGVKIHYCAEQFENDGSPVSNIIKSIKRMMAGEYSRELSVKVHAGQSRLIERGYRQGGTAGYGLRRLLLDEQGNRKQQLEYGERKSIQTDRVILVRGPTDEIETVKRIYQCFVHDRMSESEIAAELNAIGLVRAPDISGPAALCTRCSSMRSTSEIISGTASRRS